MPTFPMDSHGIFSFSLQIVSFDSKIARCQIDYCWNKPCSGPDNARHKASASSRYQKLGLRVRVYVWLPTRYGHSDRLVSFPPRDIRRPCSELLCASLVRDGPGEVGMERPDEMPLHDDILVRHGEPAPKLHAPTITTCRAAMNIPFGHPPATARFWL